MNPIESTHLCDVVTVTVDTVDTLPGSSGIDVVLLKTESKKGLMLTLLIRACNTRSHPNSFHCICRHCQEHFEYWMNLIESTYVDTVDTVDTRLYGAYVDTVDTCMQYKEPS